MNRQAWWLVPFLLLGLAIACREAGQPHSTDVIDDVLPTDTDDVPAEATLVCSSGQVFGPTGACMAVGIQGCAAVFVDEDGLCRPSMDKCPKGTIPKFDEGCVPVGIQGCAAMFIEEDGLCHPSMDKCPKGTIPKFDKGCVPVGIQGCAAMFVEEDGLCHPRMDKCPKGTIPKFDEGCMPVGIPGCAAVFLEDDGLCHPRSAKCPSGTFAVPSKGCVAIDGQEGCGEGTWGTIADGPDTVYVNPAAPDDLGSGTKEAPVRTIASALARVPEGGRIALAEGDYPEGLEILRRVEIVGRCPSKVRLSGTVVSGSGAATVRVLGVSGVVIRRIGIGGDSIGISAMAGAGVTVKSVWIHGAMKAGLMARDTGTVVDVEDTLVQDGRFDLDGSGGGGLSLGGGANVRIARSAFVSNPSKGIVVEELGTLGILEDSVVEGTLAAGDGTGGVGLELREDTSANVTGCAIVGNRQSGVQVAASGAHMELEGCAVENNAVGIVASAGGVVNVATTLARGNGDMGLQVQGAGTRLNMSGSLISEQAAPLADELGVGLMVCCGAEATITDNGFVANRTYGIWVLDASTQFEANGNLVEGTLPWESSNGVQWAVGISVEEAKSARIEGNAIVRNYSKGIGSFESEGTSVLSNLVEATQAIAGTGDVGIGIEVYRGTAVISKNAVFTGIGHGIHVTAAGDATILGNRISGPTGTDDDEGSMGILVTAGAKATVQADALIELHDEAIGVDGEGTRLEAKRCLVYGTRPGTLLDIGMGIAVSDGAVAEVSDCAVSSNHDYGVFVGKASASISSSLVEKTQETSGVAVFSEASLDLSGSVIQSNPEAGIIAGQGATLAASGCLIADSKRVGPGGGFGVWAFGAAQGRLSGNAILRNAGAGVVAQTAGTVVDMNRNLVEGMQDDTGLLFFRGAVATLDGDAVVANRYGGIYAQDQGTRVTVRGTLVTDMLANAVDGTYGVGVGADGANLDLNACLIQHNLTAGVAVWQTVLSVSDSVIRGTLAGLAVDAQGTDAHVFETGDGVLALRGSDVIIDGSVLEDNARAGVLLDDSTGRIAGNLCRNNQYGLAVSNSPELAVGDDNRLAGNAVENFLTDGSLPISIAPLEVPSYEPPAL